MSILTPETHPEHDTVGHYFKAHGCIYLCDSYDTTIGYWMTPAFGEEHALTGRKPKRTNVSERAIGRTFHIVHDVGEVGRPNYRCRHRLTDDELEFVLSILGPAVQNVSALHMKM
jgi:hypothetical protein